MKTGFDGREMRLKACAAVFVWLSAAQIRAGTVTATVLNTVSGYSPLYIGANEGGAFSTNHLADSGINLYRIWTTMGELEYYDDDWVADGYPGWPTYPAASYYGQPTPDEVRTNAAAIHWTVWDDAFTRSRWTTGVPFKNILDGCKSLNVKPLLVLRTLGPNETWITWIPGAPNGTNFWNEWWTYCFAVAYWCNVSNDYGITHFQVHNEPDLSAQGWTGTQAEYIQLVNTAHDALTCANSLAGLPVVLHAPVTASYNSTYLTNVLSVTDTNVDAVDYHVYDKYAPVAASLQSVKQAVSDSNPDSTLEPVWISEWGSLDKNYNTLSRGLKTAENLFDMAQNGVEGAAIFMMYDWGGNQTGLISTNLSTVYDSYYAFRLMTRALIPGREILQTALSDTNRKFMATRGADGVFVIALTNGADLCVDVSGIGYGRAHAVLREYSPGAKDTVTSTSRLEGGVFHFNCSSQALVSAFIDAFQLDTDADGIWDGWERQHFTNLTTASSSTDYDSDRFPDFREFIAGTNPSDSNSCLKVSELACENVSNVVLKWQSASNILYAIEWSTNLLQAFHEITNSLPATVPVNTYTNAVTNREREYYRVRVDF